MLWILDSELGALQAVEIARENITLSREIGQGEFGVVMEGSAINLSSASVRSVSLASSGYSANRVVAVAVKLMKDRSSGAKAAFVEEAKRLLPLNHENVCRLLAVWLSCFSCFVV